LCSLYCSLCICVALTLCFDLNCDERPYRAVPSVTLQAVPSRVSHYRPCRAECHITGRAVPSVTLQAVPCVTLQAVPCHVPHYRLCHAEGHITGLAVTSVTLQAVPCVTLQAVPYRAVCHITGRAVSCHAVCHFTGRAVPCRVSHYRPFRAVPTKETEPISQQHISTVTRQLSCPLQSAASHLRCSTQTATPSAPPNGN